MRKFTVKDFITYNNPCFGCGKKITFKIGYYRKSEYASPIASYLRPIVLANYTEVDLKITYIDSIKLYIFHKDNKILSNNQMGLVKYLSENRLCLQSTCTCHSEIETEELDFHLVTENQYVSAVEIKSERLVVKDADNMYQFYSSFPDKKSILQVYKQNTDKPTAQPTIIEMPLIPKYKFRNKEHFLDKMRTYILFS